MQHALRLAARQLGRTMPNPSVGCVIVQHGQIVGVGATGDGGRPHAETEALAMAGERAKDATAYVTLEPCSHHSKTPPCADALIQASIAHVVVACRDPNPQVNGQGIALLQQAGIAVTEGVAAAEAWALNEGFFRRIRENRPHVIVKIATSADGFIAHHDPANRWITDTAAREHGHMLRATHDAILTGIGTVLADDPLLNCRLPGLEDASPIRIVLNRKLRLPLESKLVQSAKNWPLWVITSPTHATGEHANALKDLGVKILSQDPGEEQIRHLLSLLAAEGITRLMVEGGQKTTASFLQSGLADWLYWYQAPATLGNGLRFEPPPLAESARKERISLGADHCDVYRLSSCLPA